MAIATRWLTGLSSTRRTRSEIVSTGYSVVWESARSDCVWVISVMSCTTGARFVSNRNRSRSRQGPTEVLVFDVDLSGDQLGVDQQVCRRQSLESATGQGQSATAQLIATALDAVGDPGHDGSVVNLD